MSETCRVGDDADQRTLENWLIYGGAIQAVKLNKRARGAREQCIGRKEVLGFLPGSQVRGVCLNELACFQTRHDCGVMNMIPPTSEAKSVFLVYSLFCVLLG